MHPYGDWAQVRLRCLLSASISSLLRHGEAVSLRPMALRAHSLNEQSQYKRACTKAIMRSLCVSRLLRPLRTELRASSFHHRLVLCSDVKGQRRVSLSAGQRLIDARVWEFIILSGAVAAPSASDICVFAFLCPGFLLYDGFPGESLEEPTRQQSEARPASFCIRAVYASSEAEISRMPVYIRASTS